MSIANKPLKLSINGKDVGPMEVPDGLMMLDFLHEYAGLTGSRLGCGESCGRSSSRPIPAAA